MSIKKTLLAALTGLSLAAPVAQAEITMGLIPAESAEEMVRKFEPMRAYLEQQLGESVKVYTATDYTGVIEAMRRKRIDVAWFGPLSYVVAQREAGAEPFAAGVRKGSDSHSYVGILTTRCDSGIENLEDLEGKTMAFVSPSSTSGGLVPTYMVVSQTGQQPEEYFSRLTYAGSHDAGQLALKNGSVDAAATNDITYERMVKKGQISRDEICIIRESDPIPGSPLTYRGDLSEDKKAKIREAILNAHKDIEVSGYGALSHYEAVTPADYQPVRDMAEQLGLSDDDILK
ncbi:MAG: phosphonate ABC transporter substrate-binding protein [Halothiobacillaceae bacterium]